ncbi:MAG: 3-phosphoshikimate 1-carboxyvinyltransferase, partial [Pseudomonadota bacterium]
GLFTALQRMGASLTITNQREEGGERVGDLQVRSGPLKAIKLEPDIVPSMVDEFPILAVAAANAEGVSRFEGLEELRVKESDRLAAIQAGLTTIGVKAHIDGDALVVEGCGAGGVPGGGDAPVVTHFDHRIAMSFLVAGLASKAPIAVDDSAAIATSFPDFFPLMETLGARMQPL